MIMCTTYSRREGAARSLGWASWATPASSVYRCHSSGSEGGAAYRMHASHEFMLDMNKAWRILLSLTGDQVIRRRRDAEVLGNGRVSPMASREPAKCRKTQAAAPRFCGKPRRIALAAA